MDSNDLQRTLSQFIGTDQWYQHPINPRMLYTDGVKSFAENAGNGAYWFLDIVATEIFPLLDVEPFIHISLNSSADTARILADDGDGNVIWVRDIEFTDCPPGVWRFYLTDRTLLLPSEY